MKKLIISIFVGFVLIQFFRPHKNTSTKVLENAIEKHYTVPENVSAIMKISCYDCHSNNTIYPWYNNVQPFGWWLNYHVNDGKRHLNFDEFNAYSTQKKKKKLEEIVETVERKEMPLSSYTLIHTDAKLTTEQRQKIIAWANRVKKNLNSKQDLN